MDAATYRKAIEYELLTRAIYESVLHQEGVRNVEVKHNVDLVGRSGVAHQIDVLWEFVQAGITHRVLIECKNYSSNLTLEKLFRCASRYWQCSWPASDPDGISKWGGGFLQLLRHWAEACRPAVG